VGGQLGIWLCDLFVVWLVGRSVASLMGGGGSGWLVRLSVDRSAGRSVDK
jgi:hypothetical protein